MIKLSSILSEIKLVKGKNFNSKDEKYWYLLNVFYIKKTNKYGPLLDMYFDYNHNLKGNLYNHQNNKNFTSEEAFKFMNKQNLNIDPRLNNPEEFI